MNADEGKFETAEDDYESKQFWLMKEMCVAETIQVRASAG